eukprot:5843498-Pyramimonas_sp.AAC.1
MERVGLVSMGVLSRVEDGSESAARRTYRGGPCESHSRHTAAVVRAVLFSDASAISQPPHPHSTMVAARAG